MSKYTTEVRFICENSAGLVESLGYTSINDVLNECVDSVFDFDYPIFDESYRRVLNIKILRHYYTREIGFETVGLWKHFLEMRMNEIMPYFNKLYLSELLDFNPLYDVDLTTDKSMVGTNIGDERGTTEGSSDETLNGTNTENAKGKETRKDTGTIGDSGQSSNTRTDNLSEQTRDGGTESDSGSTVNKNTRWDVYSDTPQGALTDVDNERYLTNARRIVDDGTGSTNSNTKTFGKTVNKTNTGTQQNSGTDSNTRTLNTTTTLDNNNEIVGTNNSSRKGTNTGSSTREHNINTTEDYIEHIKGKTPGRSFSSLLKEFRETFLNIDMLIIDNLSDLFFNLW